jgi:hypothetical protein
MPIGSVGWGRCTSASDYSRSRYLGKGLHRLKKGQCLLADVANSAPVAEHRSGATDPVPVDEPDGQGPKLLRNPAARPPPPPCLKPAPRPS